MLCDQRRLQILRDVLPEALCPPDAGRLVAGQMMTFARLAFARYASADVRCVALQHCTQRQLGRLLVDAAASFRSLEELRLDRWAFGGGISMLACCRW